MKFLKPADRIAQEIKIEQTNLKTAADRITAHLGQLHVIANWAIDNWAKKYLRDGTKGLNFISLCDAESYDSEQGPRFFIAEYKGWSLHAKHRFYKRIDKLCKKLTEETGIDFRIFPRLTRRRYPDPDAI
jgi:hypothetical protein